MVSPVEEKAATEALPPVESQPLGCDVAVAETERAGVPLLTIRTVRVCGAVAPCAKLNVTAPPSTLRPPVAEPLTTMETGKGGTGMLIVWPSALIEKVMVIWNVYDPARVGTPLTRLLFDTVKPGGTSPLVEVVIVIPE